MEWIITPIYIYIHYSHTAACASFSKLPWSYLQKGDTASSKWHKPIGLMSRREVGGWTQSCIRPHMCDVYTNGRPQDIHYSHTAACASFSKLPWSYLQKGDTASSKWHKPIGLMSPTIHASLYGIAGRWLKTGVWGGSKVQETAQKALVTM